MLCSKLHCQTGFDLIPVSFKVGRPERGGGDSRLGGDGWRDGTARAELLQKYSRIPYEKGIELKGFWQ